MARKEWEGTTYGNSLMHRWLIGLLRWMDIRIIYVFAYIFVIPPCLLFRPGAGVIYRYFRQRFGCSPWRAFIQTYKNHCVFAEAVIDKFAMYAGKKFQIKIEGYDHFLRLAERPEGFVQFSSHVGNYEIAGYSLVAETKRFNALVFSGEKASVMANRDKMFEGTNIRMIPIGNDMSHIFAIDEALQNGEIMSLNADRVFGSGKTIELSLLGKTAHFPLGPFSIATMRELDVLAVHVMKTSWTGYTIYVTPLPYKVQGTKRKEQIAELATAYVAELERIVRLYPTQWYNFYEFWQ